MAYEGPAFVAVNSPRGGETAQFGRDDNLHVEFYQDSVLNTFKTNFEGRPVYDLVEMVYIHAPGNKSDLRRKVRTTSEPNFPSDPERFPRQWRAFKDSTEQVDVGTPVDRVPFIQPHRAMELKASRIHTLEQLAMLPDQVVQGLGMDGRKLRDHARAYLDDATRMADIAARESENNELRAELAAMKQQLADLAALRQGAKDDHQS
jgi:hypothetical protein